MFLQKVSQDIKSLNLKMIIIECSSFAPNKLELSIRNYEKKGEKVSEICYI
jgi:hypothetical protein